MAAPAVTGISPATGPTSGGTSVTITGTGFTGATAVDFGTHRGEQLGRQLGERRSRPQPGGRTGTVDVTVARPRRDLGDLVGRPVHLRGGATVTGISPTAGPLAGGTSVTITGTGFTGATAVDFGTVAASNLVRRLGDADHGHQPGGIGRHGGRDGDRPGGTSATSSADQFTYVAAPTVTGVSPTAGPIGGRHVGDDHGDGLHRRHGGGLRHDRGNQPDSQFGERRSRPPARPDRGTVDVTVIRPRRHLDDLVGRPVHLHGGAGGDRRQSGNGADQRRHVGDDHGDGLHRRDAGGLRHDSRPRSMARQLGDADHGHEPGGAAGTVDVTVTGPWRHLGDLVGRPVHLHGGPR